MKKISLLQTRILSILAILAIITGCTTTTTSTTNTIDSSSISSTPVTKATVMSTYADIVYASYEDSLVRAQELLTAVQTFTTTPSQENFDAAKEAWLASRIPYGQTEGYRFYSGPIDDENGPEGELNAWPLDENYIDYTEGEPNGGIVNMTDDYPTINASVIRSLNDSDSKNISAGYHAIEFLLWGQDLTEGPGAGTREYTDYVTDGSGTNSNQERRAAYLNVVTAMLVEDLQSLVTAWSATGQNNYRATFLALDEDEALTNILRGIGTLAAGELSSQRIATPLKVKDREEEHSCFSDNTHVDIVENATSIQNVFLGSYTRIGGSTVEGPSIYDLLLLTNPSLATQVKSEIESSMTAVNAIQAPFDQEILGSNPEGNIRVLEAVTTLDTVGSSLVDVGVAFGLTVTTTL